MNEETHERLERRLQRYGGGFSYPSTPDLVTSPTRRPAAGRRRLAWALVVVLFAVALVAVPPVRAQLVEWLRIGGISIQAPDATADEGMPEVNLPLYGLADLTGESSLEQARASVDFSIGLPGYPPDLGGPDHVYLQAFGPEQYFAILAWGDESAPNLVLYVQGPGPQLTKSEPDSLIEVPIDNSAGAYVQGTHLLILHGADAYGVLVEAPVLIWEGEGGMTYRLEADLPLDEMILIAESIE